MAIKLNKQESLFRNELIFASDAKAVKIDNTLLNLCMLLRWNGVRPKTRVRRESSAFIEIKTLQKVIEGLEGQELFSGFTRHEDATEMWLRSNLLNMVYRGDIEKEKISSLRPIHLESYRVRNAPNARDYNSADQVYLMLSANPELRQELKDYLGEGWDTNNKKIITGEKLDVDSLGILRLIQEIDPGIIPPNEVFSRVQSLLQKQANLFCDDVHKILVYKREIPRSVIIEYLKNLIAFHLSLYMQKVIHWLPEMILQGTSKIEKDWNIVVDMTDNLESRVSQFAIQDAELVINKLYDYIRSTFKINAVLLKLGLDHGNSSHLEKALKELKEPSSEFETYFKVTWNKLLGDQSDEERERLANITKYDDSFFDKYIQALIEARGGYHFRYSTQFLDNISQKNDERGIMVQGRSKRHPRRFVIGTRLLETLVQVMVLKTDSRKNAFYTSPLSIEELIQGLRERYGLIINGIGEERFKEADIPTVLAFKENVEAFKKKLRQIGFYNNLSDAYILQKVNPRYSIQQ